MKLSRELNQVGGIVPPSEEKPKINNIKKNRPKVVYRNKHRRRQEILQACADLERMNQKLTIANIQSIAGGSNRLISKTLKEYYARKASKETIWGD